MCHEISAGAIIKHSAMGSAEPSGMPLKAIGCGKYREIIGGVAHLLTMEINKWSLSPVSTRHAHIVSGHQRFIALEEIVFTV